MHITTKTKIEHVKSFTQNNTQMYKSKLIIAFIDTFSFIIILLHKTYTNSKIFPVTFQMTNKET